MSSPMTPSVRTQRWIVFLSLWVLAAATIWFTPTGGGERADAQSADSNHQPFACAQSGSSSSRRQTIDLSNDSVNGNASGKFYPCVSGVPFRFGVGNLSNFNGNSNSNYVVAKVDGVYASGAKTLYWGANGSRALEYLAFKNLSICTGSNAPVSGCATAVNNNDSATYNDLAMYGYSSGTSSPKPKTDYVLRFRTDGPATIGGNGIITDMVVDGTASKFSVVMGDVTAGSLGCVAAGGSVIGGFLGIGAHTCQGITVSSMAGLSWLTGVQSYRIRQLEMTFYYLSTHIGSTTNPYTDTGVNNSVQLPNTRITVCPTTSECTPSL